MMELGFDIVFFPFMVTHFFDGKSYSEPRLLELGCTFQSLMTRENKLSFIIAQDYHFHTRKAMVLFMS